MPSQVQQDPKTSILVTGSRDTTLKIWDPVTCECLQTLTGHKYQVHTEPLPCKRSVFSRSHGNMAALHITCVLNFVFHCRSQTSHSARQMGLSHRHRWTGATLSTCKGFLSRTTIPTAFSHTLHSLLDMQHAAALEGWQVHSCAGRP